MKKYLLFICGILYVSALPAIASGKEKIDQNITAIKDANNNPEQIYRENKQEIAAFKSKQGKTLYVGEGIAEIKKDGDIGEAKRQAKERAMTDLISSVRVRVKSIVRDELKYSDTSGGSENFEQLVESYIDQAVNTVQDKYYIDYPRHGDITVIVYVSKSDYDASVASDIQAKTDRIKGYAIAGAKTQSAREIRQAIENYINGKIWLKNYFEDLPVKATIQATEPEDLGSYFDTHLTQILHSIKLESVDENIIYDTEGKVSKKPMALFSYEDTSGKTSLSDMPAKASFAKGKGTISSVPLRSGRRGEVYVPIEWVDPAEREAIVQVEIDTVALNLKDSQGLPVVYIPLSKSKAVAWAVNFFKNGKRENPTSLSDSVKMALNSTGYELKPINITEREITDSVVSDAREMNVDYIIYVCSIASSQIDEYGMYKSKSSSKVYIYSFYDNRLIEAIEGPSKSGYSTSASGAAYDALSKLNPGLLGALKEKIRTLK